MKIGSGGRRLVSRGVLTNMFGQDVNPILSQSNCVLYNLHHASQLQREYMAEVNSFWLTSSCLSSCRLLCRWFWDEKKNWKKFAAGQSAVRRQLCCRASCKLCCKGLLCKASDRKYLLQNRMIASYVADISWSEDLLSVNKINQTAMPCRMSEVRKEVLWSYSRAPRQCSKNIKQLVSKHIQCNKAMSYSAHLLDKMTLLPTTSVPVVLSSSDIQTSVDVYTLFRLDPIHNTNTTHTQRYTTYLWE